MIDMPQWPATRITLLDRLWQGQDEEAWTEFVGLYGPLIFTFARRRLPQDDDAADVMQEVFRAVLKGTYQRPEGRFQKWLVTVVLNKIRNFHAARNRHAVITGEDLLTEHEEVSRGDQEEWDRDRQRQLFRVAAEQVRARTSAVHWDVFVRTAVNQQSAQEVAGALQLSPSNVYAIKCRILKEVKEEIQRLEED
jgi:RNA polymerase sigma-70 factor (ECF subfamily)